MKYITRSLALLAFLALTILPLAIILVNAFWQGGEVVFGQFFEAISEVRIYRIILRTLTLALCATAVATILALPAAWICSRTTTPFARVFTFLAFTPLLIPSHSVAYSWMQFMLTTGQMISGKTGTPLLPYFNMPFSTSVLAFYYFPVIFYGSYAAFRAADPLRENVALLYQPPWRVVWKVMLPAALPYIIASIGFGFLLSFMEYGIPSMLTVNTFVTELFVFMSSSTGVYSALALSMLVFVFILVIGWFVFRKLPTSFFFSDSDNIRPHTRFDLGGYKYPATGLLVLIFSLTTLVPVAALVIRSFALTGDPFSVEPSYFAGLKYFKEAILLNKKEVQTSLMITPVICIISVLVALPLARMLAFSPRRISYLAFVFTAMTFLIPGTVFGIGILQIYRYPIFDELYSSPLIIVLAHVGRFTPIAILVLAAGMMRAGRKLEFVARLHGVSDLNAYLEVFLPAIKFEFWLAVIAVAVFSLSELGATILVTPPNVSTITAGLYIMMHYGNEERVSALALMQILVILLPTILFAAYRVLSPSREVRA